uniref:Epidermal growth factor receptor substrate 15-like 1 n=1 Tax=Callorhinchus milii TaxID=7868 RepID=V9L7H4_CALMI
MSEYEVYEKKFKDATLPHFASGISSFLSFAELASVAGNKELDDPECRMMKLEIESCYDELGRARTGGQQVIESLTAQGMLLAANLEIAEQERTKLEEELRIEKDKLITEESRRQEIRDKLQTARSSLKQAKNTLIAAKARQGEKVTGRDVGIGLILLVPCVGIPMTVDCSKELKKTRELVNLTDKKRQEFEASITEQETELRKCNEQIPKLSKDIARLKEKLAQKERDVENLKKVCAGQAEVRSKLRYCYNYLDSLHGSVEVLHKSSKCMYSLEPLWSTVQEIFNTILQQNSHNELLNYDSQVQGMIKKLKVLQSNMNLK